MTNETISETSPTTSAVELAAELTIAWLGNTNNRIMPNDVPAFLQTMFATVTALDGSSTVASSAATAEAEFTPAVSVRKSLASRDHIISLIDGKPYKALRRHLSTNGLTPEQYRERYKLKSDYPMVAEAYSESRRAMAKKIGLGRKKGDTVAAAPAKRGRPKSATPAS